MKIINEGTSEFSKLFGRDFSSRSVEFVPGTGSRSYYDTELKQVFVTKTADVQTIVHELGHWIETEDKAVLSHLLDYYDKRTANEPLVRLRDITDLPYGDDELTRKDKFIEPYMGKDYDREATEILSMGLELFYSEPEKLLRDDPDFFDFIFDLARGQ